MNKNKGKQIPTAVNLDNMSANILSCSSSFRSHNVNLSDNSSRISFIINPSSLIASLT
jgi:hypothetical protein